MLWQLVFIADGHASTQVLIVDSADMLLLVELLDAVNPQLVLLLGFELLFDPLLLKFLAGFVVLNALLNLHLELADVVV